MMENKYLKFKEARKRAYVSRSTLRRRLFDELKRSGLNWDDPPDLVREKTTNIIKVIDGKDEYGGSLYHWEYSTFFLDMVRRGVQDKAEYVQGGVHDKVEHTQEDNEHTQNEAEYVQGGVHNKVEHTQEDNEHTQNEAEYVQGGVHKDFDYVHEHAQGLRNKSKSRPDYGQNYVQVDRNYLSMLKEEYRTKKRLEEDYRNKDNQINLIVRNLSKAIEALKDRIRVLEAPKENNGEYSQETEDKERNNNEIYE